MTITGVKVPKVLIPNKQVDHSKWAVVACDQFTSQPAYWKKVEEIVGLSPSTLHLIFPEVYLEKDDGTARILKIQKAMKEYLSQNILVEKEKFILVRRETKDASGNRMRTGLMACIDLEHYDYEKGSKSLIRPTEGTIVDRLPPRMRVRENAPLELPHVMLLIDDPEQTVIEPLWQIVQNKTPLYDVSLMQGGGHLKGYAIDSERAVFSALEALLSPEEFEKKYALNTPSLLFAVGDGNHSLATAKAVWENSKKTISDQETLESHPARFALVEIVNVHDKGLTFEPIHRILFALKQDITQALQEYFSDTIEINECSKEEMLSQVGGGDTHRIGMVQEESTYLLTIKNPKQNLPVASLQSVLDPFLEKGGAQSIDYVHGTEVLYDLGSQERNVGFYLPSMPKSDLFKTVLLDGALPRKTFSMGEANEKRYYFECRRILPV